MVDVHPMFPMRVVVCVVVKKKNFEVYVMVKGSLLVVVFLFFHSFPPHFSKCVEVASNTVLRGIEPGSVA